jgi:TRAP-type C4-dicarboxylate transport system substrate-binding protein
MQRRDFLATLPALSFGSALAWPREGRAEGPQQSTVLRIATLAPNGSSWMRVFNAWGNTLNQRTGGRLQLRFFSGGSAGDERDVVRKMREGQLDGGALTTVGLGQIVRPVLVLQAPGACRNYAQVDAVRKQLAGDFDREFDAAGYKLLGWGDAGVARIFSNRPVLTPADMRQTRIWSWRDDPTWQSVLDAAKVTGVSLGLPEVYPALRTNRIDAFPGTALAAVAFQWHTRAAYVTRDARGVVIGALVLRKEKFDALAAELKAALVETGDLAHKALTRAIRQDDQTAFDAIVKRGVSAIDGSGQAAAWDPVLQSARRSLVGKLYSAELLQRVERIAQAVP